MLHALQQCGLSLDLLHKREFVTAHELVLVDCSSSPHLYLEPLQSVIHGSHARPTVTFPVTRHCYPVTGTKLYCLVTDAAHVSEQLVQSSYLTAPQPTSVQSQVNALTIHRRATLHNEIY